MGFNGVKINNFDGGLISVKFYHDIITFDIIMNVVELVHFSEGIEKLFENFDFLIKFSIHAVRRL
jgi:hypothetical protein